MLMEHELVNSFRIPWLPRSAEDSLSQPGSSGGSSCPANRRENHKSVYGVLVVLGYNGSLPEGEKGRRRSHFTAQKRNEANGVLPSRHYLVTAPQTSRAILDTNQHSISYTLTRNQAVIVEYDQSEHYDMFQIGRSSEQAIDFVIADTVPGRGHISKSNMSSDSSQSYSKDCLSQSSTKVAQSTISRFACRILVDRSSNPAVAKVYAAGFDSSKNIFLGEKATKWQTDSLIDGLTTNGVLLLHPRGPFGGALARNLVWREVSVGGALYTLRESRSAAQKGEKVDDETNELQDGSLIDLCGATLLWRSAEGMANAPTVKQLEKLVDELNANRPQCPVGLNTLVLPRKSTLLPPSQTPYVYLACGHVQGLHEWGCGQGSRQRTCPMCMVVGPVAQLCMGMEPAFWVDCGPPTHAFNPCGHIASERTVKFWESVALPHGTNGFASACPFCATPLEESGYVKLIFQDNVD